MRIRSTLLLAASIVLLVGPLSASAASKFEVTGWLPYWRSASSTRDVLPHLDKLTGVNPFVYTMKKDGTIVDNGDLDEEPWLSFIAAAREKKVRVIPTIMSGDGATLHATLSNSKSRIKLEDDIAALVKENSFDGIDIDFEGKRAETKTYFSTFLKGLYQRLGKKWLMCTIESRTPLGDRYYGAEIPADATIYSNDFKAINKYCDRVRIMAYDQQGIDQSLSSAAASSSELYAPVADPRWVRKTVEVAARDINKNKILVGIPTYGYGYDVTAYANNEYMYKILWTFNPGYAWPIARQLGITPSRNSAGELFFTYQPDPSTVAPLVGASSNALLTALAASAFADAHNSHQTFRMLNWPDAQSVAGKIELAQMLGVRGVSILKLDGGQDPGIWNVLEGVVRDEYVPETSATTPAAPIAPPITRALSLGSVNSDVRTLQIILNSDYETLVAESGPGSIGNETTRFGAATQQAVKKFQVKYEIAKSGNSGYGRVGPATRVKLNVLLKDL